MMMRTVKTEYNVCDDRLYTTIVIINIANLNISIYAIIKNDKMNESNK